MVMNDILTCSLIVHVFWLKLICEMLDFIGSILIVIIATPFMPLTLQPPAIAVYTVR